ncbi:hypothetical protein THAOC_31826 [Thalassiosira oceanica]|uniref:Uncharacterized protein n=1 Tax=Thalassiosira oceanica TaxID=159749 RepID=K0RRN5_THAOC|nr:hypothetical protein THAOC_31826 [Thalassiosira oceanica]|eukprot:EJK49312.1 hypothetical protein THAOC_31826 [Thalassiosira oceanica]
MGEILAAAARATHVNAIEMRSTSVTMRTLLMRTLIKKIRSSWFSDDTTRSPMTTTTTTTTTTRNRIITTLERSTFL